MKLIANQSVNHVQQTRQDKSLFVLNQFYPPDYAPTGQLIQELVSRLASQKHLIKVFTGQPGYAYKEAMAAPIEGANGIVIRRTRATRFWSNRIRGKLVNGLLFFLRAGLHLLRHLRKDDVLLLTTAPPFLPILGYFLKRVTGASYICLVYDLYPDVAVQLGVVSPRHFLVKFWDFLNRQTWGKADKIIVLSSSMKERIVAKHPKLASKISVIHNWSDPKWIKPINKSDNWFARQYNLDQKFTVLYSGNMGRCHDLATILDAAYQLQNEPIQFVFIGGGAEYQNCIDTVKAWGLENCLFLPYQDKQVLPYSLTACDLSLVSLKPGMEGIVAPSKFYSMLASGRPIAAICEKHSYLRQILEQANCGAAFESGDPEGLAGFIRQMAAQPELAQRLGQAGRLYLTLEFTPEIIADQYLQVLGLKKAANIEFEELVRTNFKSPISFRNPRSGQLIGEILQEVGLLSTNQVEEILACQASQYCHLRFGELAVLKGWLKQETINFILHYKQTFEQVLQETRSLLTLQVDEILENHGSRYGHLQFAELAVFKGWMAQETIDFVFKQPLVKPNALLTSANGFHSVESLD